MDYPLLDFVLASLLMGLGIGADVALATVSRSRYLLNLKTAATWIVGVSLTHTLFPMLGYLLTYFSLQLHPLVTPIAGVVAFGCIFFYLKSEIVGLAKPQDNTNQEQQILITLGLILAVSWDALWSGPAKSAQVIGWPELLVWLSFIVVGCLVSALSIASLKLAKQVIQLSERNPQLVWFSYWLQYSVIGYFGLLAVFRYTLQINIHWWQILIISMLLTALSLMAVRYSSKIKAAA
jgi:uncharacterized protein (DUF983 family)